MKVLLLMADANMHKFRVFGRWKSAREAPLTLTTLAALGADQPDIEFRLVDESIDRVPLDEPADLVAISVLTGTAPRAYALADHFRRRGIPVVLGGIHVSILPDEAARHADAVVVGMAEETWPRLLRDFQAGRWRGSIAKNPSRATSPAASPRRAGTCNATAATCFLTSSRRPAAAPTSATSAPCRSSGRTICGVRWPMWSGT